MSLPKLFTEVPVMRTVREPRAVFHENPREETACALQAIVSVLVTTSSF